jgi:hypothetical protein
VALHLRAMNMLYEAIKRKGSMVIVPSSAVETMGLGGMLAGDRAVFQPTVHANSPFAGTWEGKLNDLPAIGLKIDDAGGKIGGTIVFYFQERPTPIVRGASRPSIPCRC